MVATRLLSNYWYYWGIIESKWVSVSGTFNAHFLPFLAEATSWHSSVSFVFGLKIRERACRPCTIVPNPRRASCLITDLALSALPNDGLPSQGINLFCISFLVSISFNAIILATTRSQNPGVNISSSVAVVSLTTSDFCEYKKHVHKQLCANQI